MPVLRGKLLAAVHTALDAGHLTLPPGVAPHQLRMLLPRLGRQQWHVQSMKRYAQGQGWQPIWRAICAAAPSSPRG